MKELKKYLHLYLGCQLLVLKTNDIVSFDDLDGGQTWPIWTRDKKYCSPKGCCANGFRFSEIKPILRPLSDMTEKEALEVCKLASPTAWGDYRFKKWTATLDPKSNNSWKAYDVKNENSPYSFIVDMIDGDITLWDEGDYENSLLNQNYRFWYLTKHFDLFGLIEAGLAIDQTKK